jgi:hypothetical protein
MILGNISKAFTAFNLNSCIDQFAIISLFKWTQLQFNACKEVLTIKIEKGIKLRISGGDNAGLTRI